jgi:hypothetical protein
VYITDPPFPLTQHILYIVDLRQHYYNVYMEYWHTTAFVQLLTVKFFGGVGEQHRLMTIFTNAIILHNMKKVP